MPKKKVNLKPLSKNIFKNGEIVGETDQAYDISEVSEIVFNEILVKGNLSGVLEYNSKKIQVSGINTIIGMEVTTSGARGPVWKQVKCLVQ